MTQREAPSTGYAPDLIEVTKIEIKAGPLDGKLMMGLLFENEAGEIEHIIFDVRQAKALVRLLRETIKEVQGED